MRNSGLRKRLWLGAGAMALFLGTLVVSNAFVAEDKSVNRQMLGHDFLAFYSAGTLVRMGRYHDLYKLDVIRDYEHVIANQNGLTIGKSFGPWWNPPFYAWVFEPLSRFNYSFALTEWWWFSATALVGSIGLLILMIRGEGVGAASWGLIPALVLVSMPFVQAISHGQNTFTSLLLICAAVTMWRSRRGFAAGIITGLLFYKPQLGAVLATALVLDLGWAAAGGLIITGAALAAVTVLTMPGALGDYLHQLPANLHWMQIENAYLWERHVTVKAFWRLLLQGREAGEPWIVTTVLTYLSLAAIGFAWARAWWRGGATNLEEPVRRDRLIAATITAMPLLMPFYFDYDLLLLAVAVTLYAGERLKHPELARASDRWLTAAWTGLFVWTFVNPGMGFRTHVNGTVLLLCAVAGLQIWRAGRKEQAQKVAGWDAVFAELKLAA